MLRWLAVIAGTLLLIIVLAAYGPGALTAFRFDPPATEPELDALFINPAEPELREAADLHGPEDLEPGPDGRLYASLADGRIMARASDGRWVEHADTGGRPLGLAFAPDGTLSSPAAG
jgi:hypothetical protein